QPEGVDAELAQPFDDPLVGFARIGHEEVIHGGRVGEPADVAALRLDHPGRPAQAGGEVVEIAAGAVDDDGLLGGRGNVLKERVEAADTAADLHDDHQIGERPPNSSPSV